MLGNKIKLDQRAQARLEVVCRVERGELRQAEAAHLLSARALPVAGRRQGNALSSGGPLLR